MAKYMVCLVREDTDEVVETVAGPRDLGAAQIECVRRMDLDPRNGAGWHVMPTRDWAQAQLVRSARRIL